MTLPDYIVANMARPFIWGEHDCVLFAARWVRMCTGKDYIGATTWSSMLDAYRIMKKSGGLAKIVDARLRRIEPNYALDGDVALRGNTLMLFSGHHIVGPGMTGLVFVERTEAKCAWRSA